MTSPRIVTAVVALGLAGLAGLEAADFAHASSGGGHATASASRSERATTTRASASALSADSTSTDATTTPVASRTGRLTGGTSAGFRPAAAQARVTATPSAPIASVGQKVVIRGAVASGTKQLVQLQQRSGARWSTIARSTSPGGRFSFSVLTRTAGTKRMRVLAGPTGAFSSSAFTVAVGRGNPKSVGYLTSPIARWNPCRAITYRVNLAGAPKGAAADVDRAVAQVSAATGLRLVKAGSTNVVPGSKGKDVLDTYPKGTDLVIAYTKPGRSGYLRKSADASTLGVGGAFYQQDVTRAGGRSWHRIVQGYLVLDSTQKLPGGFGLGNRTGYLGTWGQVLMHELGHVVGLDHPAVKDSRQIMYPATTRKSAVWGAGDLTGLRRVGATSGCL